MQSAEYLRKIRDRLLPGSCVFCGVGREYGERNICDGCNEDLPWIESARPAMGNPLEYSITPLGYQFPIDVAIKALKFKRKLFYAPALAEILCDACEQLPPDIDAVVPVPLHWRRKTLRGFNQAMELAAPVAKHLDVALVRGIFRRRATPFQTGLGATERERNLARAFGVRAACQYAHVLIVDDVVTTGATTRSLARALLASGAGCVSVLALARATSS